MTVLWLSVLLAIHSALASPILPDWNSAQQTLENHNGDDVPAGWHDPRLNGGRFLDVRCIVSSLIFY